MNMVGTPGITVGLVLVDQLHGVVEHEARHDDDLGAFGTAKFITAVMANTWKKGSAASTRSLPRTRLRAQAAPCWQLVGHWRG